MSIGDLLRSRRAFASAAGAGTAGVVALAIGLTTCGSSPAPQATPVTAAPAALARAVPATTAPTTTVAPTSAPTTRPTTTTAAPTTAPAPTTVATTMAPRQLTTPVPPPADERAPEPVILVGRLTIPTIDVDMDMYEGIRLTTLDLGPGHWPGSAMPGDPGNVVVGGHRTSKHAVFRHVGELEAGDELIFTGLDGAQHVYVVNRVEIVTPDSLWIIDPTDTMQATLFACHPPGSTRERIIVFSDFRETIPAP